MKALSKVDARLLDACLRYARRHRGLTASNPSVGTFLVQFEDGCPVIVGRGITAIGGRPHAERVAVNQAGERARGATAYVTLEPCAHHGATPPCAQGLIDAGVARVVTAWTDPDERVDGKGHEMLRATGVDVSVSREGNSAVSDLAGYLNRKVQGRPQTILKLAVSSDGMLGKAAEEMPITGNIARSYVHRMRAEYDAILVGRGTVETDDPELTCRLPGLESRSPRRFVLTTKANLCADTKLAQSARDVSVSLITSKPGIHDDLVALGVTSFAAEDHDGELALPEILEDMAADGISSLMIEGGAKVATSFLKVSLIDSIALFTGPEKIGSGGIKSPVTRDKMPDDFQLERSLHLGDDCLDIFARK